MPRHTKLTPAIQKRYVDAINVGATQRIACDYAGISQQTLYNWRAKAEAGRAPYVAFIEQLKLSEGAAAVGWLAKIEKAANEGNWQAAAWKLERRYPHEYGRTVQEQHVFLEGDGLATLLQATRGASNASPESA